MLSRRGGGDGLGQTHIIFYRNRGGIRRGAAPIKGGNVAGKGTFVIDGRIVDVVDDKYGDNKDKRTLVIGADNGWWRDNEFNSRPQQIPVEFVGKVVDQAMQVRIGDLVRIDGNLSGREYNGKYYCNLEGRDISVLDSVVSEPVQGSAVPETGAVPVRESDEKDPLPF